MLDEEGFEAISSEYSVFAFKDVTSLVRIVSLVVYFLRSVLIILYLMSSIKDGFVASLIRLLRSHDSSSSILSSGEGEFSTSSITKTPSSASST